MSKTFDVLIGSNYYYNFIDQKIERGNKCEPIAVYSTLGWIVSGPAKESSQVTHVTTLYVKVEYQLEKFNGSQTVGLQIALHEQDRNVNRFLWREPET
ncbi:hypothetical protein T11_8646 [Trichinella zimbabwensis]|uniref:Peptidase aspartic putative domain-containing protein n=1 Tax=Trichinella zimbabwensis TaxID=268475 RepID=A0A0V1GXA1_9BILA|nr:hypothetical protein T11_8646 [Trichinella zimbabwensis]